MRLLRLIGLPDDATEGHIGGGENFILDKFTAIASGTMSIMRVHHDGQPDVPAQCKVAIYDDNEGEPGILLNAVNTAQTVSSGWFNINFPHTQIISGTVYWLAYAGKPSTWMHFWQESTGGVQRYKSITFSTFTFPSPAGVGFISSDDISHIAGYEEFAAWVMKPGHLTWG